MHFLSAVIGFWFVFNFVNPASAANIKNENGWIIRQSSNFGGTVFSDITDHALKMHIGKMGLTIIAKGPQWNAFVFNENSKTYIELPYKEWQKKFVINNNALRDGDKSYALGVRFSGKTSTIENHLAKEYVVYRHSTLNKNSADDKVSQLWMANDIRAPHQVAQIFCSHLGIPPQEGIPLEAKRVLNGKMISVLETLSIERRVIAAKNFEPLSGYKKVKNEIQLFMGENSEDEMNDLLDLPRTNNLIQPGRTK